MKKIFLYIIMSVYILDIEAQKNAMIEHFMSKIECSDIPFLEDTEVTTTEKRVKKLMKKNKRLRHLKTYTQYHIFDMYSSSIYRPDNFYKDYSFLDDLHFYINHYGIPVSSVKRLLGMKETYPSAETLICDDNGNLIAFSNGRYVYEVATDKDRELARIFSQEKFRFAFREMFNLDEVFCIKDDTLFVLLYKNDKWYQYSLNEFINFRQ